MPSPLETLEHSSAHTIVDLLMTCLLILLIFTKLFLRAPELHQINRNTKSYVSMTCCGARIHLRCWLTHSMMFVHFHLQPGSRVLNRAFRKSVTGHNQMIPGQQSVSDNCLTWCLGFTVDKQWQGVSTAQTASILLAVCDCFWTCMCVFDTQASLMTSLTLLMMCLT